VSPAIGDLQEDDPTIYLPLGGSPDYIAAWVSADNAALLADAVRRTIADIDPEMPVVAVRTLADIFEENTETLAMTARTAAGLGIVSLLLAVSGLYSVIAFFVALRTSEFGIRLALGARSSDIVRMVLGQALRLAGVGLAVGAVLGTPLLMAQGTRERLGNMAGLEEVGEAELSGREAAERLWTIHASGRVPEQMPV
jgi:putative ABC transport system permease protein